MRLLRIRDQATKQVVFYQPRAAQLVLRRAMLEHNRVIVPKARRLGASTEVEALFVDKMLMADRPLPLQTWAHREESARTIAGMARSMIEGLPPELGIRTKKMNESQLVLDGSGASQLILTARGHGAGRGEEAAAAHLSEFDYYPDADEVVANVESIVGSGLIVAESTIYQPNGAMRRLVDGAPDNGWHVCFLPWTLHPAYRDTVPYGFKPTGGELALMEDHGLTIEQVVWRRRKIASMTLDKFRREFPLTVEEAFATQSKGFFPLDCYEDIEVVSTPATGGRVILADAVRDYSYTMGVDVSAGVGADYSAATITDAGSRQPVAHWRDNRVTPRDLPEVLINLGARYDFPMLVVESNVYGRRVIEDLMRFGYPRRRMWLNPEGKPWRTHGGNRAGLFELARATLQDGHVERMPTWLFDEVRGTGWDEKRGRPDHAKGAHDDTLVSWALSLIAAQDVPLRVIESRSRLTMEDLIRARLDAEPGRAHPFNVRGENTRRRPM